MEDDDFDDIDDNQLAALDAKVSNLSHTEEDDVLQSQADFLNISDEQFAALDEAVEQVNRSHSNQNDGTITLSQLELAAAIFDDDDNEPTLEHLQCLRSKFQHSEFRSKQWEIIDTVMNKRRDVSAVMATGYGKSLCFQFPAIYKNGMVLVISPLISLMKAQVISLTQNGINACLVGSAQSDQSILLRIQKGEFQVIYSCPEYLQNPGGQKMLNILSGQLTLIAIDGEYSFESK